MHNQKQKQRRHPQMLIDRPDHEGNPYGLTSFPSALLKANVVVSPIEKLFLIVVYEHLRHAEDKPFPSDTRIGLMMRISRKQVAKIREALCERGLLVVEKRGRGFRYDFAPLLKALLEAPPIAFPKFDEDGRDSEIVRLRAENEALKNLGVPVPVPNLALAAPVEEQPQVQAAAPVLVAAPALPAPAPVVEAPAAPAQAPSFVEVQGYQIPAKEIREALDHWLFSDESREVFRSYSFVGRPGKLKPVDMGGKHPVFRRADIDRIKAEGVSVLKKIARQPRAPALPVEVEPLESMLARAKQLAKAARAAEKSPATQHQTQHADPTGPNGTH